MDEVNEEYHSKLSPRRNLYFAPTSSLGYGLTADVSQPSPSLRVLMEYMRRFYVLPDEARYEVHGQTMHEQDRSMGK